LETARRPRDLAGRRAARALRLRIRRGQLEADLDVRGIIARDPALCAGLTPSTDLWTLLTIDDGFDPPLPVQTVQAWACREQSDGDRELLALPGR
jgi:hypothetical protein